MYDNNSNQQAYDRGVSVFSPEGRLYQVEYAREAVTRGAVGIGIKTTDGVVFASETIPSSSLVVEDSVEKVNKIENSIGAVSVGYTPDGRTLVDKLRLLTQQEKLRYDAGARVENISKQIADHIQESTQVGGRRPYGTSLIIGGVDETGPRLFEVEPGGTPTEWNALAEGNNRNDYINYFENEYTQDLSTSDGILLAVDAMNEHSESEITPSTLDIATITEDEQFNQLTNEELSEYCE